MKIIVDFRDPGGYITTWTMVSFTYIVVSRYLNGAYSDIWATVASINNPPHNTPQAIDQLGGAYTADPSGSGNCAIFTDPDITHDYSGVTCSGSQVNSAGNAGGVHIVHAYIMGFRFNPAIQTNPDSYLYAGVLTGLYPVNPDTYEITNNPGTLGAVNIIYGATPPPNGP